MAVGQPGLLIVISGPSGVGKDTLVKNLLERDPRLRYSVSFTTRPKRDYELDGEHYTFVDEQRFKQLILEGEFLENATYNGRLYGTSASRVAALRQAGHDVILKIEVQGAEHVRRKVPDGVFIFIAPPSMDELLHRREGRGSESEADTEARQRIAEWEMSFRDRYDYVVVNDDLERAVGEVLQLIERERERRRRK